MSEIKKQGYLEKQSRTIKVMRKRFTVLREYKSGNDHFLHTYKQKGEYTNPTESIRIDGATEIRLLNDKNNLQFYIENQKTREKFTFKSESSMETNEWYYAIQEIIDNINKNALNDESKEPVEMKISHDYVESEQDEVKESESQVTILVGSTGTGKSLIIKLHCGNGVVVGHGTESQTKESKLFLQIGSKHNYWLDSQGANDSSGVVDQKVLTDILKTLYGEMITSIRVIWLVSGDMCRAKQEFLTQAGFINSLGNNVWDSCLIIKKKGALQPEDMEGVLAAANKHGANMREGDKRLFGFTALDFGPRPTDRFFKSLNKEQYKDEGYLTNKEIIEAIDNKLKALPYLQIEYKIETCTKCGQRGDQRFIYAPCHGKSEMYHPKKLVPYHEEELEEYHPGKWENIYISNEFYHTKGLYSYRPNTAEKVLSLGVACAIKTPWKYECCDALEDAPGCEYDKIYEWRWTCCNSTTENNTGCEEKYECCGGDVDSNGCGRYYPCCDYVEGTGGCEERCQSCQAQWGKGPGCTKTTH